jgi:hypothetical protein
MLLRQKGRLSNTTTNNNNNNKNQDLTVECFAVKMTRDLTGVFASEIWQHLPGTFSP